MNAFYFHLGGKALAPQKRHLAAAAARVGSNRTKKSAAPEGSAAGAGCWAKINEGSPVSPAMA